jgi:hypothetical protein
MRLSYPHMFLIELKGDIEQKLAVSGCMKFETLKNKIQNNQSATKCPYFIIKKGLMAKIMAMTTTVKEAHDRFQDHDGYLRIYVRQEASF